MTTPQVPPEPDADQVQQHVQEFLGYVTAATTTAMVALGDRLGLYQSLADSSPVTSHQLAELTGTEERYVREWLAQQAAAGLLHFDPADETFTLSPEWAVVLTDPGLVSASFYPAGMFRDFDAMLRAFRSGAGIPWGDHDPVVFETVERFWAGQYRSHLITEWIPALEDIPAKLTAGATVADIGTGHGAALIMLAQAYPDSRFFGFDDHEPSIRRARERAAAAGVEDRVTFEVATSHNYPVHNYDLITFFDTLHDLGDPVGAAAYARGALDPGGVLLLVEPQAADDLAENLRNPAAPLAYAASTFMCTPGSLSQPVGRALGGQAGERTLREVLTDAGFTTIRRLADTPFNMVLEARP